LPGPKKLKRPSLAISSFKKGQILKNERRPNFLLEICSDLSKIGLKIYYFCQHSKKAKKWPNGETILFLANSFKKAKFGRFGL